MTIKSISKNTKSANLSSLVYIHATRNNTIITVTDLNGNTLVWGSPGCIGFKGARRSTSYAAQAVAEHLGKKIKDLGIRAIYVYLKGLGEGRESSVRGFKASDINILSISDITPIPHNGCRLRKKRRM